MSPDTDAAVTRHSFLLTLDDALWVHAALRDSEERYQLLFDSIDEGFCIIEVLFDANDVPVDYRFVEVNRAFGEQTGLTDALGRTMREIAPNHEEHWFATYGRIARTGKPERFRNRAEALQRDYDVYAFRVGDPSERRVGVLFQDITARKHTEDALRESEARNAFLLALSDALRGSADAAGIQAVAVRVLGEHLRANRAFFADVDEARDAYVVTRDYADGMPPLPGTVRRGEIGPDAIVLPLLREGRVVEKLVVERASPREWTPGEVALVRETADRVWPAVERARAEEARRASEERERALRQRETLRRLLQAAEEEERRRLSRELHDESGQHLAALSLGLRALSDATAGDAELRQRVRQLRGLTDSLGRELHALALRIRPGALDDFGLEAAVAELTEEWSRRTDVSTDVHFDLGPARLPSSCETAIYRMVQEALTNIARHSGARRASIVVERRDGQVSVVVEDDGRGISNADSHGSTGLGLAGIRERVALLDGELTIESSAAGTSLFVRMPVPREPDA